MTIYAPIYLQWTVATVPVTEFQLGLFHFVTQFLMDKNTIFIGFWFMQSRNCYWLGMIAATDTHRALQAMERLQTKLRDRGDIANEEKLSLLKSVLQSPLFNQILSLQTSVQQLRDQVGKVVLQVQGETC